MVGSDVTVIVLPCELCVYFLFACNNCLVSCIFWLLRFDISRLPCGIWRYCIVFTELSCTYFVNSCGIGRCGPVFLSTTSNIWVISCITWLFSRGIWRYCFGSGRAFCNFWVFLCKFFMIIQSEAKSSCNFCVYLYVRRGIKRENRET